MKKIYLYFSEISGLVASFVCLLITSCGEVSNVSDAEKLRLAEKKMEKAEETIAKWEALTTADYLDKCAVALKGVLYANGVELISGSSKAKFTLSEADQDIGEFLGKMSQQLRSVDPSEDPKLVKPKFDIRSKGVADALKKKGSDLSGIPKYKR